MAETVRLLPSITLATGHLADFYPVDDGEVDVAIWSNEFRDSGVVFHCADLADAQQRIADFITDYQSWRAA